MDFYRILFSIWEKFLAGSEYIFAFLTVHILHHCRLKLLNSHSTKEMMQYLIDLKVSFGWLTSSENIANKFVFFEFRSKIKQNVNILSWHRLHHGKNGVIHHSIFLLWIINHALFAVNLPHIQVTQQFIIINDRFLIFCFLFFKVIKWNKSFVLPTLVFVCAQFCYSFFFLLLLISCSICIRIYDY